MAKVFLQDKPADRFGMISARLALILKRPVKYSETAMILSTIDDATLTILIDRYNAANREPRTA